MQWFAIMCNYAVQGPNVLALFSVIIYRLDLHLTVLNLLSRRGTVSLGPQLHYQQRGKVPTYLRISVCNTDVKWS